MLRTVDTEGNEYRAMRLVDSKLQRWGCFLCFLSEIRNEVIDWGQEEAVEIQVREEGVKWKEDGLTDVMERASSHTFCALRVGRWEGREGVRTFPTGHTDLAQDPQEPTSWGGSPVNTQVWHKQRPRADPSQENRWTASPGLKPSPLTVFWDSC